MLISLNPHAGRLQAAHPLAAIISLPSDVLLGKAHFFKAWIEGLGQVHTCLMQKGQVANMKNSSQSLRFPSRYTNGMQLRGICFLLCTPRTYNNCCRLLVYTNFIGHYCKVFCLLDFFNDWLLDSLDANHINDFILAARAHVMGIPTSRGFKMLLTDVVTLPWSFSMARKVPVTRVV